MGVIESAGQSVSHSDLLNNLWLDGRSPVNAIFVHDLLPWSGSPGKVAIGVELSALSLLSDDMQVPIGSRGCCDAASDVNNDF